MYLVTPEIDRLYSVDEYFDVIERLEYPHEYHDGSLRPRHSEGPEHSHIKMALNLLLGNYCLDGPNEVLGSDLAISIPDHNAFVLADMCVVIGEPTFADIDRRRLLNPSLLIEVVSDSTGDYDYGEKFQKYRSLDSFREYMLIDSRRYAVECWYKEDEKVWRMDSAFSRSESVYLHTLKVDISLEKIYRRVFFND